MNGQERFMSARLNWHIETDAETDERYIQISGIYAKEPCKGHGTEVLHQIKAISQRMQLSIRLHPWAENGDHDRLKAWYERNGFWDTGDYWVYRKLD